MVVRIESNGHEATEGPHDRKSLRRNNKLLFVGIVMCIMITVSFRLSNHITRHFMMLEITSFDIYHNSLRINGNESIQPQPSTDTGGGSANDGDDDNASREIQVLLPADQIDWMKNRPAHFDSFYEVPFATGVDEKLFSPADSKGPILDFVVAGFPKCGTTTLMANLAQLAPMPEAVDVCTPPSRTVLYAYDHWPKQFGQLKESNFSTSVTPTTIENHGKLFRSSKCPTFIEEGWVGQLSRFLPKTKLIVGIRHPILWYLSFWKMQGDRDPYERLDICPCNPNDQGVRRGDGCGRCRGSCPQRQLYCLGRARFHLPLARLGKTALSDEERELLAPNDIDGGKNLANFNITNSIFLYEQTELRESYLWKGLSKFLAVSHIPNRKFQGSVGKGKNYTLCTPYYDDFRAALMPYSYELSEWMQKYFLPVAKDQHRPDVVVADVERLSAIVRTFADDPCDRLIRTVNGTYALKMDLQQE